MTSQRDQVPAPISTPGPGLEICYECEGSRLCWACQGDGKLINGQQCHTCAGRGACMVCNGVGQLPSGTGRAVGGDLPAGKRRLMLVGNFREMGYDDQPDAPSLHDIRGKGDRAHKAEIVAYLRGAKSISYSPGYETSIFDPAVFVGTHTMRTDGVYIWPDFTAGYVEKEDVSLPYAFEQHMAQRGWRLPDDLDLTGLVLPETA